MTFKKRKLFCILLCAVLLVLSASCSGGGGTNDGSTPSDTKKLAKTEKDIKITQTAAKSAETEKYETADFTMTIPKGRKVTSGGTNIYHSIRVYDPEEPINQMFILLKQIFFFTAKRAKRRGSKTTIWATRRRRFSQKPPCFKTRLQKDFSKSFRNMYAEAISGYIERVD